MLFKTNFWGLINICWVGGKNYKGAWENFGVDGYVHGLDCGDIFMGAYLCQNSSKFHLKYLGFIVCQL